MFSDQVQIFRWRNPNEPPGTPALMVRFREQAEKNEQWSLDLGYDAFDNVLVALVCPPGGAKSEAACEIERRLPDGTVKVHPVNARKYAEVVKAYKENHGEGAAGTPLKELGIDPGQIATLRAKGIHSIEMMAEVSDNSGDNIMGFRGLKDKAVKFLELREKEAPTKRLEMELAQRDQQLASLQRQLEDLQAAVQRELPERRGPGRPPKVREAEAA